ncbi:MAG: transglutaminase [Hyphococcus sp.]|nr:MAG: transglutaminase [Marinicaulis sp.]
MNNNNNLAAPPSGVSTDLLQVHHVTRYRYARPVHFGEHRAMFRPHDSNDLQLAGIYINTRPSASLHWVNDVFSNSTARFNFTESSDTLEIDCTFNVVRSTVAQPEFPIADFAKSYPFLYPNDQFTDLIPLIRPEYDHPEEEVKSWAQQFIEPSGGDTWALLKTINKALHETIEYRRRDEPGVQAPRKTIQLGHGSCRDYAVLMLEAVRQLGFAARFVTGYLYDPASDGNNSGLQGAGATHAWVQIYLPGAGWIEFDPTNGSIASGNLIRTGVARTPSQAVPLEGSFKGAPEDFLGLDVHVEVKALAPTLKG